MQKTFKSDVVKTRDSFPCSKDKSQEKGIINKINNIKNSLQPPKLQVTYKYATKWNSQLLRINGTGNPINNNAQQL